VADVDHQSEHAHPGVGQYVEIAIILAVMTLLEVVIFESMDAIGQAVGIPSLIVLTVLKFMLVVMWFMHLRFDHKMFRRFFVVGVILAMVVYSIVAVNWFLGENIGFCCT
jgi:cytochrome c oxidase subunit 4